jgi:hypothetical protein
MAADLHQLSGSEARRQGRVKGPVPRRTHANVTVYSQRFNPKALRRTHNTDGPVSIARPLRNLNLALPSVVFQANAPSFRKLTYPRGASPPPHPHRRPRVGRDSLEDRGHLQNAADVCVCGSIVLRFLVVEKNQSLFGTTRESLFPAPIEKRS